MYRIYQIPVMVILLTQIFTMTISGLAHGQEASGEYDGGCLFLGFNPQTQVLTGYFECCTGLDERTNKPLFCCMFLLYGKKAGSTYQIKTWYPGDTPAEVIEGELTFGDFEGPAVHVKLKERPPGSMAYNFDPVKGNYLTLDESRHWLEIRMVSAPRAYFHQGPDSRSKKAVYVVRNDVVKVLKKQGNWVLTEFEKEKGKLTRGWIREDDLFPLHPPKK